MKNSDILNAVITDLTTREQVGFKKYQTTVDRTDLSDEEWLQHLYEELLDAVMYIKKYKQQTSNNNIT